MARASKKRPKPRAGTPAPNELPPFLGHAVEVLVGEHEGFRAEVVRQLEATGFEYVPEAAVGGLEFDFAVYAPGRRAVAVLELKSLVGNELQFANRAIQLAREARDSSGADAVFLVTPRRADLPGEATDAGLRLLVADELAAGLKATFSSLTSTGQAVASVGRVKEGSALFAAMPFSSEFDDTYFVAIVGAAKSLGLTARRVDQEEYVGDIVDRIRTAITSSRVVVVDLSRQRPNVMYELGLADGLGVPVVHISQGRAADLPFDVSHKHTLFYHAGRTSQLIQPLAQRIRAALGEASDSPTT